MATLFLCDCGGSQQIDRDALAEATGHGCPRVATALCTTELGRAAEAMNAGETIIACRQEAPVFEALAEELGVAAPHCVDIRDRAGWSDEGAEAAPKMAALLAEAALPAPAPKTRDVESRGLTLVLGAADVALPVAEALSENLSVTCCLTDAPELLPRPVRDVDVAQGRVRRATGSFGRFNVRLDAFCAVDPAGRGALGFTPPRDGAVSDCDLIVDLRGEAPLFPAPEKRDGYLRADPGNPAAVAAVTRAASHLTGTFERTLFVALDESLCAHSRASQTGCTRCLDLCPTGAIAPDGDHVAVDADICAGCGACSAVCPSGAIAYDDPPVQHLFARIRTLSKAYLGAGGAAPRLLVHDASHGREMIALAARLGRGLPADVVPLEVDALAAFGHAEALVALAQGFVQVDILLSPRSDRETLDAQTALADTLANAPRTRLLDLADPDALSDTLYADAPAPHGARPILPLGGRRDATRLAVRALVGPEAAPLPLPDGAPYGAVVVDTEACTLCLSCAGLCPSGALGDNPDAPQLTFVEDACLQCGLCANVCPEDAITLAPRFDPSDAALRPRVLHEEPPAECISCGAAFGVQSTIERIVAKLEGAHPMFRNSDNARLIRMCDDCRVKAQYHADAQPFSAGPRPRVRTTEDYRDETKH